MELQPQARSSQSSHNNLVKTCARCDRATLRALLFGRTLLVTDGAPELREILPTSTIVSYVFNHNIRSIPKPWPCSSGCTSVFWRSWFGWGTIKLIIGYYYTNNSIELFNHCDQPLWLTVVINLLWSTIVISHCDEHASENTRCVSSTATM